MRLKAISILFILAVILVVRCKKEELIPLVIINDNNFLNALIELGVDTDGDGKISFEEAESVTSLNISNKNISDLTGIERFTNLDTLDCRSNKLTKLDVTNNTALEWLCCSYNQLTVLDVSDNTALTGLYCDNNQLTSLDVTNNTALMVLLCYSNQLTSLDVSNNVLLANFKCRDNQLTTLDVSNNTLLLYFECQDNQLTNLDVSNQHDLREFWCGGNQLTTLDISNNSNLGLNVSSYIEGYLEIENMPTLEEVCVWTMPSPPEGFLLCADGSPNVYFTMDCSK